MLDRKPFREVARLDGRHHLVGARVDPDTVPSQLFVAHTEPAPIATPKGT